MNTFQSVLQPTSTIDRNHQMMKCHQKYLTEYYRSPASSDRHLQSFHDLHDHPITWGSNSDYLRFCRIVRSVNSSYLLSSEP